MRKKRNKKKRLMGSFWEKKEKEKKHKLFTFKSSGFCRRGRIPGSINAQKRKEEKARRAKKI